MTETRERLLRADPMRPSIPARPAVEDRPFWSVMIPTYDCADYLRETLASVLAQDPGPDVMQIEVVDDESTRDDPEAVVSEVGRGRVDFFRQPRNVGHVRNFNTCIERARGRVVHLLHGDDLVEDGFYAALGPPLSEHPDIGAAFCRVWVIDGGGDRVHLKPLAQPRSGVLQESLRVVAVEQPIQTPSIVVRRSVYEAVGGFDRRFERCGEDLEMWIRIAAHYPLWYEAQALALYRYQEVSLSGQASRTGQNIRETRLAIEISKDLFPSGDAVALEAAARQRIGLWALGNARDMIRRHDHAAARMQVLEAVRCSRSAPVVLGAAGVLLRSLRRLLGRTVRMLPGSTGRGGGS